MALDDLQRSLGRMEGKVDGISKGLSEFKTEIKQDLAEVKIDVKLLNQFKWRVAGGAAILSLILTGVVEIFHFLGGY